MADSLADDLREHLHITMANYAGMLSATPGKRVRLTWVMTMDWLNECRKLDTMRSSLWHPGATITAPMTIMGLPVDVRDDGGVPHLEAAP